MAIPTKAFHQQYLEIDHKEGRQQGSYVNMVHQANNKAAAFFNIALILSFLLLVSISDSRVILGNRFTKKSTVLCDSVYGAQSGDTCFSVAEAFNLTSDLFATVNPNINCDKIFVGQWLCVRGVIV